MNYKYLGGIDISKDPWTKLMSKAEHIDDMLWRVQCYVIHIDPQNRPAYLQELINYCKQLDAREGYILEQQSGYCPLNTRTFNWFTLDTTKDWDHLKIKPYLVINNCYEGFKFELLLEEYDELYKLCHQYYNLEYEYGLNNKLKKVFTREDTYLKITNKAAYDLFAFCCKICNKRLKEKIQTSKEDANPKATKHNKL